MNLDDKLRKYKNTIEIIPNEQNIEKTVLKSIEAFCLAEQERVLNYWEFLWEQLKLIRKRWWALQLLVLFFSWLMIPSLQEYQLTQRSLGAISALFVILIVPELWKSQTYQSMEIEAASYYSLRQIYSARMLLFGMVDMVLITAFLLCSSLAWKLSFEQLLVQFIFPMLVTSCICFGTLCSKYPFSESIAVIMCVAWSIIWWLLMMNERVYALISFPLWLTFLGLAFAFFVFTIYRTLHNCNNYWEVNINGIDFR